MTGSVLGAAAALSYGVTVVLGRTLAKDGLGPATALGCRFTIAALVVMALLAVRGKDLLPARGELVRIFLLGFVGYTTESTLFFLGLERGTAAAAALVFYSYPALVMVLEVLLGREKPHARLLGALALSTAGTVVLVTSGSRVAISAVGVACALGSAAVFAVYLLASSRLVGRSDPLVQGAWVAVGAAASCLGRGVVTETLVWPGRHWPVLVAYGLCTASAFVLTFAALARLGATRTAVIMTLEAFSAVVLAAVFLGESLAPSQLAGGAAILVATLTVARRPRAEPDLVGHATDAGIPGVPVAVLEGSGGEAGHPLAGAAGEPDLLVAAEEA